MPPALSAFQRNHWTTTTTSCDWGSSTTSISRATSARKSVFCVPTSKHLSHSVRRRTRTCDTLKTSKSSSSSRCRQLVGFRSRKYPKILPLRPCHSCVVPAHSRVCPSRRDGGIGGTATRSFRTWWLLTRTGSSRIFSSCWMTPMIPSFKSTAISRKSSWSSPVPIFSFFEATRKRLLQADRFILCWGWMGGWQF